MFLRSFLLVAIVNLSYAKADIKHFSFGLPNGKDRPAILYTPSSSKTGTLLVVLHGGSRNAELAMNQDSEGEWNTLAEKYGWFVLYPSGTVNQKDKSKLLWNDCRASFGDFAPEDVSTSDVIYLDALIRDVVRREGLSQDKVFVTGHSNGGGMTFRMAIESSLSLRAIAPMLMTLPRSQKNCKEPWKKPLPTAYVLGTSDPMVNFIGGKKGRSGAETLE